MQKENKIFELIKKEEVRQRNTLMMIPSENYTYPEVREAVGSVLMHKYAEGQPLKRYYQGQEFVDNIELLCEKYALETFDLNSERWGVNVQAYSGTPANIAIYNSMLNPGDKILAMYLPDGGHLSHGWEYKGNKVTLVSKIYNVHFYHVDKKTQVFNYDEIAKIAKKFKPRLLISGGTAYPREINHRLMKKIAESVGGYYLADVSHESGLIAGGANKSPFRHADFVMMTTHKTIRGPRGALIFSKKKYSREVDKSVFPGTQGGPHLHTIAGIALTLKKAQTKEFKRYAWQVVKNAKYIAKNLNTLEYDVVSGGTDKHLVLIDLRKEKLNGWFVAWALEKAGIIVNRNTVPYDTGSPYYPSGLRLGTPAITARGMKEKEMEKIVTWIDQIIKHLGERVLPSGDERGSYLKSFKKEIGEDAFLNNIREKTKSLCNKYPVP